MHTEGDAGYRSLTSCSFCFLFVAGQLLPFTPISFPSFRFLFVVFRSFWVLLLGYVLFSSVLLAGSISQPSKRLTRFLVEVATPWFAWLLMPHSLVDTHTPTHTQYQLAADTHFKGFVASSVAREKKRRNGENVASNKIVAFIYTIVTPCDFYGHY